MKQESRSVKPKRKGRPPSLLEKRSIQLTPRQWEFLATRSAALGLQTPEYLRRLLDNVIARATVQESSMESYAAL